MAKSLNQMRELRSAGNALVKVFRRALKEGVTRDGLLAVEGPHLIEEALKPGSRGVIRSILIAESSANKYARLIESLPPDAELVRAPDSLFAKIAQTETPQGIAALVELAPTGIEALAGARDALLLIACGVQDPGNLGAMLRSAHGLGATALLALKGTVSPFNPKAVRASTGAIFHLPVMAAIEPQQVFAILRARGVRRIAAERESPSPASDCDLRGPVALLIGREGSGLEPDIARQADVLVSIPIRQESDSLNAASAAAIFLYEAARQRKFRY